MRKFPLINKELLAELEKRFPDTCPDPSLTIDQIRVKQGEISVIRFLRSMFEAQSKNVLENK